ncbi:PorP/SprF family type IX secretion system membrane protein [Lewinella sp. 4G2]|uniref:PorP/SprF family type IX secretion system membrane protein n=1 Tax=Lewinella sp. 4G2 TaxID=1803372 RepID=UPI0007B4EC16|nr:PorP/SprF family type IX secretion system membrane protein [Lewinella sp. 4G2]OAV43903.1 hypothetical protein A3850_005080 [Lewinella sp. 4G2]
MKQWLLSLTVLLISASALQAQDPAVFNHYVQSPVILNPAAVGFADEYRVMLNTRAAWAGFNDAPTTFGLRANGPIGESFGLGFTVLSESAAQLQRTKGQIDVSFRVKFGNTSAGKPVFQGGFGFFTEFQRLSLDGDVLNNVQNQLTDERLQQLVDGENRFDAGIGFYGTYLENTFGGITINNLVANRLQDISGRSINEGLNYTFLLGHRLNLENSKVSLTPSIMMRNIQDAPFMLDVNLQAGFVDDQFLAGLSYRYLGAMGLLLGTQQKGFRFFYSFDLGFGGLEQYSSGSHEFTVGYVLSRQELKAGRDRRARAANRQ